MGVRGEKSQGCLWFPFLEGGICTIFLGGYTLILDTCGTNFKEGRLYQLQGVLISYQPGEGVPGYNSKIN